MNEIPRSGDAYSSFLRNAWYLAEWVADLPRRDLVPLSVLGEPIVVYRRASGGWAALEDVCCHRLVPLSLGRLERDCVRCRYHGLKFAPDGRCVEIPGQTHVSSTVRVGAYPVEERYGGLWVWMGEAERADASLVPPLPGADDSDYVVANASIDIEANAALIWDNLNDLSHVPFVHENSFAGGDPVVVASMLAGETSMGTEVRERGLHTKKWHEGKPHPFLAQICDELLISDFVAPGALLITVRSYPRAAAGRNPADFPTEEPLSVRVASQVVTPVTDRRSRIFFSSGSWVRDAGNVAQQLRTSQMALAEDKMFIDAQQGMMWKLPHRKPISLGMDAGVVRFRGVMRKLLEAERMSKVVTEPRNRPL